MAARMVASVAAAAPRKSDVRVPQTTCEKTSLPWSVVPKKWCHEGDWLRVESEYGRRVVRRDQRREDGHRDHPGEHDQPDARLRVARAAGAATSGRPGSWRRRARVGTCCTLERDAPPPWAASSTATGWICDTRPA